MSSRSYRFYSCASDSDEKSSTANNCNGWTDYSGGSDSSPPPHRNQSKRYRHGSIGSTSKQRRNKNRRKRCSNDVFKKTVSDGSTLSVVLRAKQRKIDEVEDELIETRLRYQSLSKENKTLKSLQRKQENEIKKLKHEESELPRLISQHAEEQRVLRYRLKRAKAAERDLEVKVRENNNALLQMERDLNYLKKLVEESQLEQRLALSATLSKKEKDLKMALSKVDKLDKLIGLSECSFSRQLSAEKRKHKGTLEKLRQMEEIHAKTKIKLKKKERELSNADVYSLRRKSNSTINSKAHKESIAGTEKDDAIDGVALAPVAVKTPPKTLSESEISHNNSGHSAKSDNHVVDGSPQCRENASDTADADISCPSSTTSPYAAQECNGPLLKASVTSVHSALSACCDSSTPNEGHCSKAPSRECYRQHGTPSTCCRSVTNLQTSHFFEPVGEIAMITSCEGPKVSELDLSETMERMRLITSGAMYASFNSETVENTDDCGASAFENWTDVETSEPEVNPSPRLPKKSYVFSKEVENLHRGIPSIISKSRKKKDQVSRGEVRFGNYSPTFAGSPKRNNKCVSSNPKTTALNSHEKSSACDFLQDHYNGTKESNLLLKLFGKIEVDKDKLLGEDENLNDVGVCASDIDVDRDEGPGRNSRGHGDNSDVCAKYQVDANETYIDSVTNSKMS